MHFSSVELTNFRNFKKESFEFLKHTAVIIGPNASGKTNLLESIFLLSTGKSFKAKVEEEMINYKTDIARVKGIVSLDETFGLEIILTRGLIDIGADRPEKVARKKLIVNALPKRLVDFAGKLKVVLFAPNDLDLVTESPSHRRKFLDIVLSQVDREYRRSVLSYEKGLRQRNKLLFLIREQGLSRNQLSFWDRLLVKNGDYIATKREEFVNFVNGCDQTSDIQYLLEYDKSAISEARLAQYASEEVAAATTLVGPHRDDFVFKAGGRDLSRYGSRGEQRMGVLWLKLSEMDFIEAKSETRPILLLDDIFSELDHKHRDIVMAITDKQQTIITTADPGFVVDFKGAQKVEL